MDKTMNRDLAQNLAAKYACNPEWLESQLQRICKEYTRVLKFGENYSVYTHKNRITDIEKAEQAAKVLQDLTPRLPMEYFEYAGRNFLYDIQEAVNGFIPLATKAIEQLPAPKRKITNRTLKTAMPDDTLVKLLFHLFKEVSPDSTTTIYRDKRVGKTTQHYGDFVDFLNCTLDYFDINSDVKTEAFARRFLKLEEKKKAPPK